MRGMEGLVTVVIILRIDNDYWNSLDEGKIAGLAHWLTKNSKDAVSSKNKDFVRIDGAREHKKTKEKLKALKRFNNSYKDVKDYLGLGKSEYNLPEWLNDENKRDIGALKILALHLIKKKRVLNHSEKMATFRNVLKKAIEDLQDKEETNLKAREEAVKKGKGAYYYSSVNPPNVNKPRDIEFRFEIYKIGGFDFSSFIKALKISLKMKVSHYLKSNNSTKQYLKGFKWADGFRILTEYETFKNKHTLKSNVIHIKNKKIEKIKKAS